MSIPVHKAASQHTVLIRANIVEMTQIEPWPMIIHRNTVPEEQPCEIATVDTQRKQTK
jgi:hypothetical protein